MPQAVPRIDGQPSIARKPRDVYFIPAGAIHAAKNGGNDPGMELAISVVEKHKPLIVLANQLPVPFVANSLRHFGTIAQDRTCSFEQSAHRNWHLPIQKYRRYHHTTYRFLAGLHRCVASAFRVVRNAGVIQGEPSCQTNFQK